MPEYQSTNQLQKQEKESVKFYSKNSKSPETKRSREKIFQRKVVKKEDFHFIFG